MGIFRKKSSDLPSDFDVLDFETFASVPADNYDDITPWEQRKQSITAPHVLTKEELLGKKPNSNKPQSQQKSYAASNDNSNAAESLYKKMMTARTDITKPDVQEIKMTSDIKDPKPNEIKMTSETKTQEITKPVEEIKMVNTTSDIVSKKTNDSELNSLFEKCKNFLTDTDSGQTYIADNSPTYTLASVDEILNNLEQRAKEKIALRYSSTPEDSKNHFEDISSSTDFQKTSNSFSEEESYLVEDLEQTKILPVIDSDDSLYSKKKVKSYTYDIADKSLDMPNFTQEIGNTKTIDDSIKNIISSHSIIESDNSIKKDILDNFLSGADDDSDDLSDGFDNIKKFNDYNGIEDASNINNELKSLWKKSVWKLILTMLITAILPSLQFLSSSFENSMILNIFPLLLVLLGGIINLNILKGLGCMLKGKPDMDTPCAVCFLCTFLAMIITLFMQNNKFVILMGCAVGACLCLNNIGKLNIISRTKHGFNIIANQETKNAIGLISNKYSTKSITGNAIEGDVLIALGKKTTNITGYLDNSYSSDPYELFVPKALIFSVIMSFFVGVVSGVLSGQICIGIVVFALSFSLCCSPAAILIYNLPLKLLAKKLSVDNSMIAGVKSINDLSKCNAIAIDVQDIFPKDCVKLYKIHVLGNNDLDESLRDVFAVLKKANSPIAGAFDTISGINKKTLPDVDSVTYEDKMGTSGWIGEKRILVGNRMLMEAHGIKLPPIETDKKILRNGYFPVYVACNSIPCVLLIIGYEVDQDIAYELRKVCNYGITIFVNSCDPNISSSMICDYFNLYNDSVKVINSIGKDVYLKETDYLQDFKAPACFGSAQSFLSIISSSCRFKFISNLMTVFHVVGIVLGIAILLILSFMGSFESLTPLFFILYQIISTFIIAIIPRFDRR